MNRESFKKNILSAASNTVLLAVLVFVSCQSNRKEDLQAVEDFQERPGMSAFDLETVVTDSGFYKYRFSTPELYKYDNTEKPYTDFPKGISFRMFDRDSTRIKSSITCKNARYYNTENLWELNNDVEAMTEKGDILNTEQMFWNTKEHVIYSDKFVKITTASQIIMGYGFESDERMSKYEIRRPSGQIEVDNTDQGAAAGN